MSEHEHKYAYGGIRFIDAQLPMAGTGACRRYYYEYYYCESCLDSETKRISHTDSTYEKPQFGASPLAFASTGSEEQFRRLNHIG